MSFKQNNPLSRKTSPINKNWIKGAIKRPGAFRKKAEEAGMSTKAFANKVIANKEDYDSRTDKQAELAKTLMGMSRNESPLNAHDKKLAAIDKRIANVKKSKEGSEGQGGIDYELLSDLQAERKSIVASHSKTKGPKKDPDQEKEERDESMSREANEDGMSRKVSPLNGKFSDAVKDKSLLKEKPATVESASKAVSDFGDKIKKQAANKKGKKTAKDAGKVDKSGRDGSNRQERKKRRQERRSIRKDKSLSASQKKMAKKESRQKQKENIRGVKK